MKRVLVTGATGFIGQYVVDRLLSEGHSVIATSATEERARKTSWFDQVRYIPFNLNAFDPGTDYHRFFGQPEVLIHLAWEGLPNYTSGFHLEVNYPRHAAFLGNLVRHGLRDLTVTGTCLEYGMQEGCLREDMPVRPAVAYARAKDTLRQRLQQLQTEMSFSLKWVRLFYMYGKGQNPGSLFSQLDRALENGDESFNMSGGEQVRDFLPVEKAAEYLAKIALQGRAEGIINCCSGVPVQLKQWVQNYLNARQKSIRLNLGYYPYPGYEPMSFWGDNSKIKAL